MIRSVSLAAVALVAAVAGSASITPAAAKACTNGVCAESTDDGRTLNVYLTTTLLGATHYNVRHNGNQVESRGRWSVAVRPGVRVQYAVQACARGGVLQRSKCTAWANFHHDVDPPKVPTPTGPSPSTTGPKPCRPGFVWRLGAPNDYVCVRPSKQFQKPGGGAYGPETCRDGYVWRNSFDGDTKCVTPAERARTGRP